MQISSVGGRVGGSPGIASYQAAKFAIDGFSRVLRAETAPFGVKVMVVEPSGLRTDWGRFLDDRPRHPRGLCPDGQCYEQPRPAEHVRPRRQPDARRGDPRTGRQMPRHPPPPASRRERCQRVDPSRRATTRRRPKMERSEPRRRFRRTLFDGAPSRHAEVIGHRHVGLLGLVDIVSV